MATYVKLPPPRQLTQSETLDSLDHWKSSFKNYFRRDSVFNQFLNCKWDPSEENYNLRAENGMTAAERKDALVDFLSNLAGFLPHSYLTSKLIENTKNLEGCWKIIEEHYNVQITPETLLDFESLKKNPEENYRQFYEKLLQHTRLHLALKDAKVDNHINATDDKMSISIMNLVALQWLRKIDTQLIKIIKTEYSTELRSGQQLAALVPKIAPNIDSLLSRYSSANVSKVGADFFDETKFSNDDVDLRKVTARGRGGGGARYMRGGHGRGNYQRRGYDSQQFCAGCFSLGKELNAFIDFKHRPSDCTRQGAVSRLLQAEEEEYTEEEDFYNDGNIHPGYNHNKPHILNDLQNNKKAAMEETGQEQSK